MLKYFLQSCKSICIFAHIYMCVNSEIMEQRIIDNEWSFVGANTKEFTHCYHNYPAMMIPQIARRLINDYAPKDTKLIFDPYCGTGTTLVEAKLANINSTGTDLNPLAQLIARSKVKNYNVEKIIKAKNLLSEESFKFSFNIQNEVNLYKFKNIEYWFSKNVIKEISFLLNLIKLKLDKNIQDFFLVALSETVREASYTRNSEFKLYRIQKEKRESPVKIILYTFIFRLSENRKYVFRHNLWLLLLSKLAYNSIDLKI